MKGKETKLKRNDSWTNITSSFETVIVFGWFEILDHFLSLSHTSMWCVFCVHCSHSVQKKTLTHQSSLKFEVDVIKILIIKRSRVDSFWNKLLEESLQIIRIWTTANLLSFFILICKSHCSHPTSFSNDVTDRCAIFWICKTLKESRKRNRYIQNRRKSFRMKNQRLQIWIQDMIRKSSISIWKKNMKKHTL